MNYALGCISGFLFAYATLLVATIAMARLNRSKGVVLAAVDTRVRPGAIKPRSNAPTFFEDRPGHFVQLGNVPDAPRPSPVPLKAAAKTPARPFKALEPLSDAEIESFGNEVLETLHGASQYHDK